MRKLLPALILVAFLVGAAPAAAKTIKIGDDYFVRSSGVPTVTVKKGATVKWRWTGRDGHNVLVSKGPQKFQSAVKTKGTYSKKITKKGTYTIICSIHAPDMRMKLKVK
jgi:plastocyanin